MKRRMQTYLVLAIAAVMLATAFGGTQLTTAWAHPSRASTLTTAIGADIDTLDPAAQLTITTIGVEEMMVQSLVAVGKDGSAQPLLATSWTHSANGLQWDFTLRRNVRFQDGEPFDAAAVKFSIDRLLSPTTFKATPRDLTVIQSIVVKDDYHVQFNLKNPFSPLVLSLSQANAGIIAPDSVTKSPNTMTHIVEPVGTGPYQFKQLVHSDHITLSRFNGYWGRHPAYAEQTYKIVPDAVSREALVKSGQAGVAYEPPPNDLPALRKLPGMRVTLNPSDENINILVNNQDSAEPLLQKQDVRQALNFAVDKNAIVSKELWGAATPMHSPAAPSEFGYCATGFYQYDPARARKMLQAAGAAGMSITLYSPNGRYLNDYNVVQSVAGYLRAVGLKVTVPNPPDWPTYISSVMVPPSRAKWDLHILGWSPPYMDASFALLQYQKSLWPPAGTANTYFDSPQADTLISDAEASTNSNQSKSDLCRAERIVWNAAPSIFLYTQREPTLTKSSVGGVYGLPNDVLVTTWAKPRS